MGTGSGRAALAPQASSVRRKGHLCAQLGKASVMVGGRQGVAGGAPRREHRNESGLEKRKQLLVLLHHGSKKE